MECSAAGVLDASADESLLSGLLERLARISGEAPHIVRQLEVVLAGPAYIKASTITLNNSAACKHAIMADEYGACKLAIVRLHGRLVTYPFILLPRAKPLRRCAS